MDQTDRSTGHPLHHAVHPGRRHLRRRCIVAAAVWFLPVAARAEVIDHTPDFLTAHGTGNDLWTNGYTTETGGTLQLTDADSGEAGSAFYRRVVNVTQGFATEFTVLLTPGPGGAYGDGITFTIQNGGPTALGNPGGDLGYRGLPASLSYAVKLDTYQNNGDPSDDAIGFFRNGAGPVGGSTLAPAVDLHERKVTVRLFYLPSLHLLRAQVEDDVNRQWVEFDDNVDFGALFGTAPTYVGFTGGTGGFAGVQQVLAWGFASVPTMKLTDIGTLPNRGTPGAGDQSAAYDVNDFGQVVGASTMTFTDPTNNNALVPATHAFVWDSMTAPWDAGESIHEIGTSEYANLGFSWAYGINNHGVVVGAATLYEPVSGAHCPHAFSTDLSVARGVPLAPRNLGSLISPAGSGSTATSLNDTSTANGINDNGQIVGFSSAHGGDPLNPPAEIQEHAFITQGSGLVDITPTGPNGQLYLQSFYAFKIDAAGEVVGLDPQAGQIALWQPSTPNATSGAWTDLFAAYQDQQNTYGGAAIDGAGAVAGLAPSTSGQLWFETWTPAAANTASGTTATSIGGNGYGVVLYPAFAGSNGLANEESFAPTIDMNDEGQVVGEQSGHATLVLRAPSSSGGGVGVSLDDLVAGNVITGDRGQPLSGWALQRATAINQVGQIVGYAEVNGKRRAFLLSPAIVSVINTISPTMAIAGRSFTIDVQGHGYRRDSQVSVNGVGLATTVLSTTHLQASVGSSAFHAGSNYVQIYDPESGEYSDEVWFAAAQTVTLPHL